MLRILLAAIVLLVAAYFYLGSGGNEEPVAKQQEAIEKAKEVEKTVEEHAQKIRDTVDEADDDGTR